MDNRELQKRVFKRAITYPPAATPAALGTGALLVGVVTANPALAAMGAVALGVGLVIGLANLLFGAKRIREDVFHQMQLEDARAKERKLDRLYRRLRMDRDSRSQRALRQLRELYESFHRNARWTTAVDRYTAVDIANSVEKLFASCVDALERLLELGETARRVSSPSAREQVVSQREQLLTEVQQGVDELARTVDEVHTLGARTVTSENVSRFRDELQRNLDVARKVEQRMRDLEAELQDPIRQRQ